MATKAATLIEQGEGVWLATWTGLADGDDGASILVPSGIVQLTAQVSGDATTVAMDGSMDKTNYAGLTTDGSTAIAMVGSTKDVSEVWEHPLYLKPVATGGTDTDVFLLIRRA